MRSGRDVDHPPHLASRLKKEWSASSVPPLGRHGLFHGELYILLLHFYVDPYLAFHSTKHDQSRLTDTFSTS